MDSVISNSNEYVLETKNEDENKNSISPIPKDLKSDEITPKLISNEFKGLDNETKLFNETDIAIKKEKNRIEIISNNDMEADLSMKSGLLSSSISIPVISTPKVTFSRPNRIRIIHSSELVGKTFQTNGTGPKIINVTSSGQVESKDVIKLVSGKPVRNLHTMAISSGPSSAKIIRILPQKETLHGVSIGSVTSMVGENPKKMVTIQSGTVSNVNHVQLHQNRHSISLSPKASVAISNIPASSAPTSFILLTPSTVGFPGKTAVATSSSLLRPAPCPEVKREIYNRYDSTESINQRSLRMNSNGSTTGSTWQQYVSQYAHLGPCPICEDAISGYHYGIFCCESCKGFFKRSVQNHKDYVCHVQQSGGEPCGINKHTRKKCPSCRFQRCVDKGMRIEAVRNDRSRGGRSLYPGSRNRIHRYSFADFVSDDSQISSITSTEGSDLIRNVSYMRQLKSPENFLTNIASASQQSPIMSNSLESSRNLSVSSSGPLHRALSSRGRTSMMSVLDNIVIIEEQLQQERDLLGPTVDDDDLAVYRVLLRLAEQRLHRMVRWSRALPEFSAIDTDDQIMLVQNCWAELLILDCCYRSLGDPREIHLTAGKCINLEAACELGAEHMVDFIVRTTQKLKALRLDLREYACLKVLLLMQPDLRQLKAEGRVRMFQETITQLLLDHTTSAAARGDEAALPNKFYELIGVVPEVRAASAAVKELLAGKDLTPFLSANSLLLELLNCSGGGGGGGGMTSTTMTTTSGSVTRDIKIIAVSSRANPSTEQTKTDQQS